MRLMAVVMMVAGLVLATSAAQAQRHPWPREWFWGNDALRERQDALIGAQAPELTLVNVVNGAEEVKLEDLRGRVVLLLFWTPWSGQSNVALQEAQRLYEAHGAEGLTVVGVCSRPGAVREMTTMVTDLKLTFPIGVDEKGRLAEVYRVNWFPTPVVVDRNGVIRGLGMREERVGEVVRAVLGDEGSAVPTARRREPVKPTPRNPPADVFDPARFTERAMSLSLVGQPALPLGVEEWHMPPAGLPGVHRPDPSRLEGRVVVVGFWSAESAASLMQVRELRGMVERFADRGVVALALCDPKGAERMAPLADAAELGVPTAVDVGGVLHARFLVDSHADFLVIDEKGRVLVPDCDNDKLEAALEKYFAGR